MFVKLSFFQREVCFGGLNISSIINLLIHVLAGAAVSVTIAIFSSTASFFYSIAN